MNPTLDNTNGHNGHGRPGKLPRRRISPSRVDIAKRRRLVLDMAVAGASYDTIAAEVINQGMSPRQQVGDPRPPVYTRADAYNDAQHALAEITRRPALEYKAMQLRRLQQAQTKLLTDVLTGKDPAARARSATALTALMGREARLTGIDEPVRTEIEISTHFQLLADMAAEVMAAGAEAAGLSVTQREAFSTGAQAYLGRLEEQHAPRQIEGQVELAVVDAEVVDDEA